MVNGAQKLYEIICRDEEQCAIKDLANNLNLNSIYKLLLNYFKTQPDVTVELIHHKGIKSAAYIRITGKEINIDDSKPFAELLSYIDGVEIHPRTDGTVQFSLSFFNLYRKERKK